MRGMSAVRARTQTTLSVSQGTNLEATAPPLVKLIIQSYGAALILIAKGQSQYYGGVCIVETENIL